MLKKISQIFPNYFVSGSVKNQKELDEAFKQYPNFSKTYIQTALYWQDTRKWYEDNWPKVYKYLDKNFLKKFQTETEHRSRAWEFHLATVLRDKGLNLEEKTWKTGPDFCIKTLSGKKVWIEAITCDLGKVDPVPPYPDMKPGVMYSFGGSIEEEHRPRALRITSAIGTKFEIFKKYLKNPESRVAKNDCLLIAINGATIQHFSDSSMLFKRAVFGQGPDILVRVQGQEKLKGGFYKPTPMIIKKKNNSEEEIPAIFMEMDDFSKISAVLYCGHTVSHSWINGFNVGDDFLFAYHSNPDNPIPENLFKFGHGIRKDLKMGSISDQEQK
ncbi:hypothetical protein COT93_00720 [Candidatus Falkowbacteria bacterium CG10_big_fil_rev_8_21_14_0_10_37_18]|uniref:Uncharacterized protein n=1 Tax=Candidatus Falkowbacteria bacterium CG10_big_fil_rev_8_21_14_0_10_37_18 TaxID=1974562 RepID=A0A2H0V9H3_9BACT|nr:MAG: hypothetical protein COT93_00720 [Candidatus Falkowbacteria bacterium CG10_big_fil_rev_8_21_14_0_10_37_18]